MRKRLLLKLGLVAFLGAGLFVGYLWWTVPTTGICRYTAEKLRLGMSKADVISVIGLPPGVHGVPNGTRRFPWSMGFASEEWHGPNGSIVVAFDFLQDEAISVLFVPAPGIPDKLRRWLHLD